MKKKELLLKAKEELLKIKKYATLEERTKLLIAALDGHIIGHLTGFCIYGTLTGYCENKRSYKLMKKCAEEIGVDSIRTLLPEIQSLYFGTWRRNGFTFLERCLVVHKDETIDLVIETQFN